MSKPRQLRTRAGVISEMDGVGVLIGYGPTVPTDGATGYATGCTFIHTDGGQFTSIYVNEGTESSCDFNALTMSSSGQ